MRKTLAPLALAAVALGLAVPAFAAGPTVKVRDDFYSPTAVTIKKGQTVTWSWGTATAHLHSVTRLNGAYGSALKRTGTFKHTFKNVGTYRFYCREHPEDMRMRVVVTK